MGPLWQPLIRENELHEAKPINGVNLAHEDANRVKEAKNPGGEVRVIRIGDGVDPAVVGRGSGVTAEAKELEDEGRKHEGEEAATQSTREICLF